MKKLFSMIFLLAALFVFTGVVFAGNTNDPVVQDRVAAEQNRIDRGIASGELTSAEADKLQDNLNRIKAEEARLKADGKLTPRERARLHRELDINSQKIYKKMHNARRRY